MGPGSMGPGATSRPCQNGIGIATTQRYCSDAEPSPDTNAIALRAKPRVNPNTERFVRAWQRGTACPRAMLATGAAAILFKVLQLILM